MKRDWTLTFLTLLFAGMIMPARAGEPDHLRQCLAQTKTLSHDTYLLMTGDPTDIANRLSISCAELDRASLYEKFAAGGTTREKNGLAFKTIAAEQTPQVRDAFEARLKEIKKIPSADERLRAVYRFVSHARGAFNYAMIKHVPAPIEKSRKKGVSGIGLYTAGLFAYALAQVSVDKDLQAEFVAGMMPGKDGYKGIRGFDLIAGGWVRATVRTSSGAVAEMDLDVERYPGELMPLEERRAPIATHDREVKALECRDIRRCLLRRYVASERNKQGGGK